MRRVVAVLIALLGVVVVSVVGAPAAPNDGGPVGDRGVFNAPCTFSHRASDDPIVFPRQPGASHSHDFFGNTSTNASSTSASLIANPVTTCLRQGDQGFEGKPGGTPHARSGYWVPTLYEDGQPITATSNLISYESRLRRFADVRPFPAGFRMIFGTSTGAGAIAPGLAGHKIYEWGCNKSARVAARATPAWAAPPVCAGADLYLTLRSPDCWDGVHLDSPNHKSHMAYSQRNALGVDGYYVCPPSHPVLTPMLTFKMVFPSTGEGNITLASGDYTTAHADFINGWDQAEHVRLVRECINRNIYCGFGDEFFQ